MCHTCILMIGLAACLFSSDVFCHKIYGIYTPADTLNNMNSGGKINICRYNETHFNVIVCKPHTYC